MGTKLPSAQPKRVSDSPTAPPESFLGAISLSLLAANPPDICRVSQVLPACMETVPESEETSGSTRHVLLWLIPPPEIIATPALLGWRFSTHHAPEIY